MVWHIGQGYGQDWRDRVLNAKGSIREMAARLGVRNSYVAKACLRRCRLGEAAPGTQCRVASEFSSSPFQSLHCRKHPNVNCRP